MTRDELQNQVAEWASSYRRIMLAWATSVGKSRGFIAIQSALGNPKTYLVVSERPHIENWEIEYRKCGREDLLKNTTILCYASLKNFVDTKVDLLGLDEVHHSSDLRISYLKTIKSSTIVAMSATTNLSISYTLKAAFGEFKESIIPLSYAIEQGWIQKPQIILIPLVLDAINKSETIEVIKRPIKRTIECDFQDRLKFLKASNTKLVIHCTELEKYKYYDDRVKYFQDLVTLDPSDDKAVFKLKIAGLERKKYLSSLKTAHISEFLNSGELDKKRFICFCGSIKQAESLSKNVIHSKISHPERVLKAFKDGKINELFAVSMLKEGVNIPNIQACVITQLDSKERDFVQKAGRALRNPDDPTVYIFFFRDTQDEKYLKAALTNIDDKYIQWI